MSQVCNDDVSQMNSTGRQLFGKRAISPTPQLITLPTEADHDDTSSPTRQRVATLRHRTITDIVTKKKDYEIP